MNNSLLVQCLQAAIGPVILVSGVGLLLLSMTNRYARIIDRSRALVDGMRRAEASERARFITQLAVFAKRAHQSRSAITLAVISLLLAATLVISLFISAFFHLDFVALIVVLFISCLVALIGALVYMLAEINSSLAALEMEIDSVVKRPNEEEKLAAR